MDSFPFSFPLSDSEIAQRRSLILSTLCASDSGFSDTPVSSVRKQTLKQLLSLYDELFLTDFLKRAYGSIDVTLSNRLTSSAGKFIYTRNAPDRLHHAEIRMSGDFLFRLNQGPFLLNGLSASSAQEAFLIVFEHELCHALENALYGSTGHSSRFLNLARGLFGHRETRHSLPTRRQEAAENGLRVGMNACFYYRGSVLTGTIANIEKNATVMVKDHRGIYQDRTGQRYSKYRVPLDQLLPVKRRT